MKSSAKRIIAAAVLALAVATPSWSAIRSSHDVILDMENDDNVIIDFSDSKGVRTAAYNTPVGNKLQGFYNNITSLQTYSCQTPELNRLAAEYIAAVRAENPAVRLLTRQNSDVESFQVLGAESPEGSGIYETLYVLLTDKDRNNSSLMIIKGRLSNDVVASLGRYNDPFNYRTRKGYCSESYDAGSLEGRIRELDSQVGTVFFSNCERGMVRIDIADKSGKRAKKVECFYNYSAGDFNHRRESYRKMEVSNGAGAVVYRFWFPYTAFFGGDTVDLKLDGKSYRLKGSNIDSMPTYR